jgi:uncharacterized protein
MDTTAAAGDLSWLVADFVDRVTDVRHAVLLSADGLRMASSQAIGQDHAERLSAVASGLQSLARTVGNGFGVGTVRQIVVEYDDAYLFVMAAGYGTCLAAITTSQEIDAGQVAYEMTMLVDSVKEHLATQPRPLANQTTGG